jgi:hypothetical protein
MCRMFLAMALCGLSTAVIAQPPTIGERMLASKAIVCDAKEQVLDLFTGSKVDDGKGITAVYQKYRLMKNKNGEPTCNIEPVLGPMVKSIEDLGESYDGDGTAAHAWLIELAGENGAASTWVLYGEKPNLTPEESI